MVSNSLEASDEGEGVDWNTMEAGDEGEGVDAGWNPMEAGEEGGMGLRPSCRNRHWT